MESADFVTTGAIMVHPLNIKPEIISNKKGKILFDGVFMVRRYIEFLLFVCWLQMYEKQKGRTNTLPKVLVVVFPKLL